MVTDGVVPFTFFRTYLQSLEHRNRRLERRRMDPTADLIKERAERSDLTFEDVLQADFVLYIRHQLNPGKGNYSCHSWFPVTLVYVADNGAGRYQPFEIFARAQSAKYFDRIKIALGVSHKNELVNLIEQYQSGTKRPPSWHVFAELEPAKLVGIENLATRP